MLGHRILGFQLRPPLALSHQVYKPASDMVAHYAVPALREMQAVVPDLIPTFFIGYAVVGHQSVQVENVAVECISSVGLRRESCKGVHFMVHE